MDFVNPDMDEKLHPIYLIWDEITYPFPSLNGAVEGIPFQKETLLEWANTMNDEITSVVWYIDKNSGIFSVQFVFTRVMKIMSFYNFVYLRKRRIS